MTWAERIELAEKTGTFTHWDRTRVAEWITCAVGEKHGLAWGEHSAELATLGMEFFHAVFANDIASAKRSHDMIQRVGEPESAPAPAPVVVEVTELVEV